MITFNKDVDHLQERVQGFNDQVKKHGDCGGYTDYVEYVNDMTNSELLDVLLGYDWSEDNRDKKSWEES
jgi:hypothetical protein